MELKTLKIKKIESLGIGPVNDLTVENVNHYISYNGVINHNSGPQYAASISVILSKAQLLSNWALQLVIYGNLRFLAFFNIARDPAHN